MKKQHDGDCSIYASLNNTGMPEAGICTCGYGHQLMVNNNHNQMYSRELEIKLMLEGHPKLYKDITEREKKKNPSISEENIISIFEKELGEKVDNDITKLFGRKR